MKAILEEKEIPMYLRVYRYYKELILNERLEEDAKLPSIRKGSMELQMSRTTMENAYLLLAAEGYILSKPQSGYYVTDIAKRQKEHQGILEKQTEGSKIRYDLTTLSVDKNSFRFDLWRRYMKSALRQDERLLSYGEPQGELEFREVLCDYLRRERSVVCSPEQIVIGAGVQSLLHILCPLLPKNRKIVFENRDFLQGRAVFEDYGFAIGQEYREEETGIYYLSPSQMQKHGGVLTTKERLALLHEASERNLLLIEDDYNSEFQYYQKPSPSLQGLAGGQGIVYLGTFSKMLLPSIRMSYMVLPPELLEAYEKRRMMYNQTASKAEQIALTQFMRDGHLASQIRKSRKIHRTKAREFAEVLRGVLGSVGLVETGEVGFQIYIREVAICKETLEERARKSGIRLLISPQDEGRCDLILNCAGISEEDYKEVAQLIRQCLED